MRISFSLKISHANVLFFADIFVTGLVGTGKKTTVRQILERFPKTGKQLRDSLYVYNFKNPDVPKYLSVPAGEGKRFKQVRTLIAIMVGPHDYMLGDEAVCGDALEGIAQGV